MDYAKVYEERYPLLRKAYERSSISLDPEFRKFRDENRWWLEDYALFMAVKARFKGTAWTRWAQDIRLRWQNALDYYRRELYYDIEFHQYLQFKFSQQWKKLKSYANANGIRIIGDIPIYVAMDSADTWAHPELFELDRDNIPTAVAGCPPDGFSATGQLWGNPLYRWEYHRSTGYEWWLARLAYCYKLYDVVRIDHFRGFDQYYSIPAGSGTAVGGHWEQGPGIGFFHTVRSALGEKEIIAEDLGYVTDSVRQLVKDSGFPGMKVLEISPLIPGIPAAPAIIFPITTLKTVWPTPAPMTMKPSKDGMPPSQPRNGSWPGIISVTAIPPPAVCTCPLSA